jgi:hypothetical protein
MVGWPTVKAIVGNAIAPSLADRYLARNAYGAQQTDQPVDPARRDNLFEPVPGDQGAHGPFDDKARGRSVQLRLNKHRIPLLVALAALAGAVTQEVKK